MKLALVNQNVVTSIVEIDEQDYSQYARANDLALDITDVYPEPAVGWLFDQNKLVSASGPVRIITKLALRQRFTIPELAGIQTALKTNVVLEILMDNLKVATFIDLNRQDTIDGIMYLVSQGLITLERANQILTTEPTEQEIYRGV
jgi:hypothetical protein